jgi:hypothetical protein
MPNPDGGCRRSRPEARSPVLSRPTMKTLLAAFLLIPGGGIGLRVCIPYVGMIRLDLSVGSGVHGSLGIRENAVAQRNRVR